MKILGYRYQLQLDDFTGSDITGQCDTNTQVIRVRRGIEPAQQASSMLHEVLEALDVHLALGLPHRAVAALEAGLYQVLVDNGVDLAPLLSELHTKGDRRARSDRT